MSEPPPELVESIFFDALDRPADQRDAFIRDRCGGNETLLAKVMGLVAADSAAGSDDFLESGFLDQQALVSAHRSPPTPEGDDSADGRDSELDRFRILSRHQEGGLGEVLIALDRQLGREVAIKQIKPKWQSHHEARQRFVQEAEVTGRLEHPGVVPVYAMGTWPDGRHFYAMRFIEGDTFKEVIARHHQPANHANEDAIGKSTRDLGLRQLLRTFVDVCDTISYAHSRQILHRDIKPANVMVGRYGETLVVDWGLAKLLDAPRDESMTAALMEDLNQEKDNDSTPTRFGGTVGTPQYMSPEQANGHWEDISRRTDIYLLGATLYEVLTGVPPHRDESIQKLLPRIAVGDFPPPHEISSDVPPALEAICLNAMATKPIDRYRTVSDLATDIERWLADEPVSVHRDSVSVRTGRWVRRHRTLAYSGAVAATLLTIGSILGSAIWSGQQAKQFRIQRENTAKAIALESAQSSRLVELRTAVAGAASLAQAEIAANRYSSASSVLSEAVKLIADEPSLAAQRDSLASKADRIAQIVTFYESFDVTNEQNVLSRDSKAIAAGRWGLEALGVWDREDWWFQLPVQDLSPEQADRLRWDVYQQWMLINAMLVKTIGVRLTGTGRVTSASNMVPAIRRFLRTDQGKREAAAAIIVSRRIELFRLSEAARWYRRSAEFRLFQGSRLAGSDLGRTRTATDSHSIGVLSMIAAFDPNFEIFFRDYQGSDSMVTARDLFLRASAQRPDYYWTSLGLSQVEFLLAQRDGGDDLHQYDAAIQSIGRCIALRPDKCFGYADRSSMYRAQARLIQRVRNADDQIQTESVEELRRWSLADAQMADRLGRTQPWVGWQHGLALLEMGNVDEAITRFLETSKRTLELVGINDAPFVKTDDLRGRSEVADVTEQLQNEYPDDARFPTLLASIRLNQNRFDEAAAIIGQAIALPNAAAHAHAVSGMIKISAEDLTRPDPQRSEQTAALIESAKADFTTAITLDPNHDWAHYGLAVCFEAEDQIDEALAEYSIAQSIARTDDQRSAALLGKGRTLGILRRYNEATEAIMLARELEPACHLMSVIRPLGIRYGTIQKTAPQSEYLPAMKSFVESLMELPRITGMKVPQQRSPNYRAALLNGDFELGSTKYWQIPTNVRVIPSPGQTGQSALQLQGGNASLYQDFSVEPGVRYRVTMRVKQDLPASPTTTVQIGSHPIISIPGSEGTANTKSTQSSTAWTTHQGQFTTPVDPRGRITESRITISGAGKGRVWIDDVVITRIP
ncbi:Serine/threonine-protein kinase PknD [Rubripirellula lacrimiformis]|uniref:Serine/threonine-protein kinase PknD n=1 Tax=Rubripirellula lacrimiformis TaxID=1930273 RepID=A0A517NLC1_9BACT|nr:protein kinase [Rubripirellula lacrimiformis]QDT07936.1 Serine/threonine-protein kinase PknD [Rubripirellula lacrimiformis]